MEPVAPQPNNQTPPPAVDPKAPAPAAIPAAPQEQTVEVELNGEKVQLSAKQIVALREKARQFDMTAKQKAELEDGVNRMLAALDEDPLALYEKRGKNSKELIIKRFKQMVEEEAQDPTQRELQSLRREKEARERQDADAKKAAEETENQKKRQGMYTKLLQEIDGEITKRGLPKDHYTLDRILRLMAAGKKARGQNFSVAEAAEVFEKEEVSHMGFIARSLPSEKLKSIFGADIIKRLNSEQVAALKNADEQAIKGAKSEATTAKEEKKVDQTLRKKMLNNYAGL
jgi:hypothetical protein